MKPIRLKDWPLVWFLGPQLEWLYYTRQKPEELPNDLTRLRIRLIPYQLPSLLLGLILREHFLLIGNIFLGVSLIILFVQGMSDWIDGYLAYHKDCATAEGAQLDPRADKLVVLPNLVIYSLWSLATSDPVSASLLLTTVLIAIALDVQSDAWYREHPDGKSNDFGKLKFTLHILVAAIGITVMIIDPSAATKGQTAFFCAFLMLMADACAQRSLQLKQSA